MICYKMNIPIEELINRVREQESDIDIKRINPFPCNTNAMVYFQCKCGLEARKTVKKILKSHAMCVTCSEVYYGNKKIEDNKVKYGTENPTPLEVSNLKLMKKGAKILEGTHDFSTFRAASCSAKSPIKKMKHVKVSKINDTIKVRFSSESFLQNQVRSMIGCLKYLATNKWSIKDFREVFKSKKRSKCAPPAPACGLYLFNIYY